MRRECGQSLVEVLIAGAILAVVFASVAGALIMSAHRLTPDAGKDALDRAITRELRIADDLLKYQGTVLAPATIATAIPMPTGSPLAATMSLATTSTAGGGVTVTIAASTVDGSVSEQMQSTIASRAPLPGSALPGGTAAAPQAAP